MSQLPHISNAVIGNMIRNSIHSAGGDITALPSGGALAPLPYGGGLANASGVHAHITKSQHYKFTPSGR